jgi:hypothetical protein
VALIDVKFHALLIKLINDEDKCIASHSAALPPGRYANLFVPSSCLVLRYVRSFCFYGLFYYVVTDFCYAVTNSGMIYE